MVSPASLLHLACHLHLHSHTCPDNPHAVMLFIEWMGHIQIVYKVQYLLLFLFFRTAAEVIAA